MSPLDPTDELTGWNILNRPVTFKLSEVKYRLMIDSNDQVIGIYFPSKKRDDLMADWWGRNTSKRPVVSFDSLNPNGKHPAPWSDDYSHKGPLFIYAHAGPDRFTVSTEEGRTIKVDGATFAEICLSIEDFQEALRVRPSESSVVLLACESGAKQEPGGCGSDFTQALDDRGITNNVFAPNQTINIVPAFAAINVDRGGSFNLISRMGFPGMSHDARSRNYEIPGVAQYAAISTPGAGSPGSANYSPSVQGVNIRQGDHSQSRGGRGRR